MLMQKTIFRINKNGDLVRDFNIGFVRPKTKKYIHNSTLYKQIQKDLIGQGSNEMINGLNYNGDINDNK